MLETLHPPLTVRWMYPHAVWAADPNHAVVTQRDRPWALVGLGFEDGKELWRIPGRFNWVREGDHAVGLRYWPLGRGQERCRIVRVERLVGNLADAGACDFSVVAFAPSGDWFIGQRLNRAGVPLIARIGLRPAAEAEWEVTVSQPVVEPGRWEAGHVLLACGDVLLALDENTGWQRWQVPADPTGGGAERAAWRRIEVQSGLVIAGSRSGTVAFDIQTGEQRWRHPASGVRTSCEGRVYLAGYRPGSWPIQSVWVLDASTGDLLAERQTFSREDSGGSRLISWPAVSETHVFLADEGGTLWALDRESVEPVWSHRPKGISGYVGGTQPVLAGGRLYITSFSMDSTRPARLYCYEQVGRTNVLKSVKVKTAIPAPVLDFSIEDTLTRRQLVPRAPHHKGSGGWTVLVCRAAGAKFYLAVRARETMHDGEFAPTEGALWVPTAADGDRLLIALRRALGSRGRARRGSRPRAPTMLEVLLSSAGKTARRGRDRAWTSSKWSGKGGWPEFYVLWSGEEKRGEIREKDAGFRPGLISLFASLVHRGKQATGAGRGAQE